jgi:hypothetical protein
MFTFVNVKQLFKVICGLILIFELAMRISIIGSGNVATHLAAAFKNSGHKIVQVYSPNYQNAALLAYHVGADAISDLSHNRDKGRRHCNIGRAIGTLSKANRTYFGRYQFAKHLKVQYSIGCFVPVTNL